MPDPGQKLVKVDDDIIAFPGEMEDEHVSRLIKSFREKKQAAPLVTEESEHQRQLKPAQPLASTIPSWVNNTDLADKAGAALWPKLSVPPEIEAENRRAVERTKQFDREHPIAGGVIQGATNLIDSLRSPANIAIMIAAPESKLLSGIFATQAATGAFRSIQEARDAYKASKNPEAFRQFLRWTSNTPITDEQFNQAWAQHLQNLKFHIGEKSAEAAGGLAIAGVAGTHAVRGTGVNAEPLHPSGPETIEGEGKPVPYAPPQLPAEAEVPPAAPQTVPARPLSLAEIQRVKQQAAALNPVKNGVSVIPKVGPIVLGGKDGEVQLRSGSEERPKNVPSVPSGINEAVPEAPQINRGATKESELQKLRTGVSEEGVSKEGVVPGVRGSEIPNASQRLQPTTPSGLVVPSVPPKIAPNGLEKRILPQGTTALSPQKSPDSRQVVPVQPQANQAKVIPSGLQGLAAEARKYPTFEEFRKAFSSEIKHGTYWHITSDPNFTIDLTKGPRDMSSIGDGGVDAGKLMITSHLDYWADHYGKARPFAALIDMSDVSPNGYRQVNRGFGNEFFVSDPSKAKVLKVVPISQAKQIDRRAHSLLPGSDAELKAFWERSRQPSSFKGIADLKVAAAKLQLQAPVSSPESRQEYRTPQVMPGGGHPEAIKSAMAEMFPIAFGGAYTPAPGSAGEFLAKEAKPTKYKYGNTQADVPADSEAGKALAQARAQIDPNDLMPSSNTSSGGGLEDQAHITVRYGIEGEDHEGIKKYLESQAPFEATLGKTTAFPPSKHSDGAAPIVVSIESPDLRRMEKEIDEHGNFIERSFPDFKPHSTLGYVKPEAAHKYIGMNQMEGKKFIINEVTITDKNGNEEKIKLRGVNHERPTGSSSQIGSGQVVEGGYPGRGLSHNEPNAVSGAGAYFGVAPIVNSAPGSLPSEGGADPGEYGRTSQVRPWTMRELSPSGTDIEAGTRQTPRPIQDILQEGALVRHDKQAQGLESLQQVPSRKNAGLPETSQGAGVVPVDPEASLKYKAADQGQPFYLKSERILVEKMRGPMPAADLQKMLLANGVKPEEMKWTGLDDFLWENWDKKVTPEQIKEFIDTHDLQIEEALKGTGGTVFRQSFPTEEDLMRVVNGDEMLVDEDGQLRHGLSVEHSNAGWNLYDSSTKDNPTKFGSYVMPGGNNYRELLVTLPGNTPNVWTVQNTGPRVWKLAKDGVLQHGNWYDDPALAERLADSHNRIIQRENQYQSSHWDEPNIVGHIRFNERTGPNGEKILHIEELQSDWHQRGRDVGYEDAERKALNEKVRELTRQIQKSQAGEIYTPEAKEETKRLWEERRKLQEGIKGEGVPDAPFRKTWHEMLLKRVLKYAVDNGFDGVAWTPGAEQAERYDLSKQVSELRYRDKGNGTYEIDAYLQEGGKQTLGDSIPADKLSDYVGKEVAQKIIGGEGEPSPAGKKRLVGNDLKVGGQGMKGFYDKIIPDAANKIGKKFGARVGIVQIPDPEKSDLPKYKMTEPYVEWRGGYNELVSLFDSRPDLAPDVQKVLDEHIGNGISYDIALARTGNNQLIQALHGKLIQPSVVSMKDFPYLPITPEMRAAGPESLFHLVYKSPAAKPDHIAEARADLAKVGAELDKNPPPLEPIDATTPEALEAWKTRHKAWLKKAQPLLNRHNVLTDRVNRLENQNIGQIRELPEGQKILWLKRAGLRGLHLGFGGDIDVDRYELGGVSISAEHVDTILNNLDVRRPLFFNEIKSMLEKARDEKGRVIVAAIPAKGESVQEALARLREELNHGWQKDVDLPAEKFKELNDAIPEPMRDYLATNYPELADNDGSEWSNKKRVLEASAKMVSDSPATFGLSEYEWAGFLFEYFSAVEAEHGAQAFDRLTHVTTRARQVKEDYFNARGRGQGSAETQGSMGGVQRGDEGSGGFGEETQRGEPQGAESAATGARAESLASQKAQSPESGQIPERRKSLAELKDEAAARDPRYPENTPEFKKWFGDSKVVDEKNNPLHVFHAGYFDEEEDPVPDIGKEGFHFGTKDAAQSRNSGKLVDDFIRAGKVEQYENEDGKMVWGWSSGSEDSSDFYDEGFETEKAARHDLEDKGAELAEADYGGEEMPLTEAYLSIKNPKRVKDQGDDWTAAIAKAKSDGYDGIVYRNEYEDKGTDSYIAFEPTQIKSVKNKGGFSVTNPDITMNLKKARPSMSMGGWFTVDGEFLPNQDLYQHVQTARKAQLGISYNDVLGKGHIRLEHTGKAWGLEAHNVNKAEVRERIIKAIKALPEYVQNLRVEGSKGPNNYVNEYFEGPSAKIEAEDWVEKGMNKGGRLKPVDAWMNLKKLKEQADARDPRVKPVEPEMHSIRSKLTYTPEDINRIEGKIMESMPGVKASSLASGAPSVAVRKGLITPLEAAQYSHAKGFRNDTTGAVESHGRADKERVGTESPDGSAPSVSWYARDLQDSGRVNEQSILNDYNGGKPALVYQSYIPLGDLPDPELAEEMDEDVDEEDRATYSWEDFRMSGNKSIPPIKVRVKKNGKIEILDGNHRLKYWSDNYDSIPAWVIDERKGKFSGLSEDEEDQLSRLKAEMTKRDPRKQRELEPVK